MKILLNLNMAIDLSRKSEALQNSCSYGYVVLRGIYQSLTEPSIDSLLYNTFGCLRYIADPYVFNTRYRHK